MIKHIPKKKPRRLRRNPVARALSAGVFRQKAVARKTVYRRRAKHTAQAPEEG